MKKILTPVVAGFALLAASFAFAADATDEMAATDLAARFPTAINPAQLVPGNPERFALQQTPEHDTIPAQQDAREFLNGWFTRLIDLRANGSFAVGRLLRFDRRGRGRAIPQ